MVCVYATEGGLIHEDIVAEQEGVGLIVDLPAGAQDG